MEEQRTEDKKTEEEKIQSKPNQNNQQKENNREWLEDRKAKSKNPNKIKDTREKRKALVERTAN